MGRERQGRGQGWTGFAAMATALLSSLLFVLAGPTSLGPVDRRRPFLGQPELPSIPGPPGQEGAPSIGSAAASHWKRALVPPPQAPQSPTTWTSGQVPVPVPLRKGSFARLSSILSEVNQALAVEHALYSQQAASEHLSRTKCRVQADLLEVFAGYGAITWNAISRGLRVLQPIDQVFGLDLSSPSTRETIRQRVQKTPAWLVHVAPP